MTTDQRHLDVPTLSPAEVERRRAVIDRVLHRGVASVYQPIVDLFRGSVIGYEAFSRCEVPAGASVGELFAQAESVGRSGDLEAAAVRSALRARAAVPGDCFLSVNVGAAALGSERVLDVLEAQQDLDGVVIEVVQTDRPGVLEAAAEGIAACRDKGASIAVATGHTDPVALGRLLELEPSFVKVGADVVSGLATSNVKLAVVDSLRHLTEALGVGLIAQGIEDLADMETLRRLGIGLGQGFLFAAPAVGLQTGTRLSGLFVPEPEADSSETVARYVEVADELTEDDFDLPVPTTGRGVEFEVLVTDLREPVALLRRTGRTVENVPLAIVAHRTPVDDVLRTALQRPQRRRLDPFVCVDEFGACLGVVRVERLLGAVIGEGRTVAPQAPFGTVHPSMQPVENRPTPHRRSSGHGIRCVTRRH